MDVRNEVKKAIEELNANPNPSFRRIKLLVVGCSTSEIYGGVIGHASQPNLGEDVAGAILEAAENLGFDVAFQCCEHLNRALVLEKEAAARFGYEIVSAVPQPKAGGYFAVTAWNAFSDPVAVETFCAEAGLDIGGTLIGMHLRRVAVPVRTSVKQIGEAMVLYARTRPKYIGGPRAVYQEL